MDETRLEMENKPQGFVGGQVGESLPVVVNLKPGTAAETSLRVLFPDDRKRDSLNSVIEYALRLKEEDGVKREGLRVQDRIRGEMKDKYGISVNGRAVDGTEQLEGYLNERTSPAGKPYLGAEIIVASRQEGGLGIEYLVR